jgi:hypothetical protein
MSRITDQELVDILLTKTEQDLSIMERNPTPVYYKIRTQLHLVGLYDAHNAKIQELYKAADTRYKELWEKVVI